MKKRQNGIKINYIIIALTVLLGSLVIMCRGGMGGAYAAAVTSVMQDLEQDENFNPADYPDDSEDYGLQVIQIAESTDNKLYLYVYQPCAVTRPLIATNINMSVTQSVDNTRLYSLTFVSSSGVFGKYLVNGVTVSEEDTRYYLISSIYRKWVKGLDEESGNDNTISEVAFSVGSLYIVETVNGQKTYSEKHLDTVYITDHYNGFIRYNNGFFLWGNSSCDSHYVAFSCDRSIDMLFEADVYYVHHSKRVYSSTNPWVLPDVSEGEPFDGYAYLTCDQKAENPAHGWQGKKYTWKRIEKASEFLKDPQNVFTSEIEAEIKNKQWVLRFFESAYQSNITTTGIDTYSTVVSDVSILRLKFIADGEVYNLGVVDNKQTGSQTPSNSNTGELEDFFVWLARVLNIPEWAAKLIFALIIILPVIGIVIPILSAVFPVVGTVVKSILKGLWWIISAPFRFIAWLIKKIRGET